MTKGQMRVHVGETMDDLGARAVDAWHRIEREEEGVEGAVEQMGFAEAMMSAVQYRISKHVVLEQW